jgi:hypothetical protein
MKQLKVSFPDELRDRIEAASAASGRSLGEEIRARLEATFAQDPGDPNVRELQTAVALLTEEFHELGWSWRAKPKARATLVAAFHEWLERTMPKVIRPAPGGVPAGVSDLFDDSLEPTTAGKMLALQTIARMQNLKERIERHSGSQEDGDKP